VRQVVDTILEVTGSDVVPEVGPRRPGDPARIVASGEAARRDLDWQMRHDVRAMVESAWRAWRRSSDVRA
jgi:UDP-glucose 4-epimerase